MRNRDTRSNNKSSRLITTVDIIHTVQSVLFSDSLPPTPKCIRMFIKSIGVSSTTFTKSAQKATELGDITQRL